MFYNVGKKLSTIVEVCTIFEMLGYIILGIGIGRSYDIGFWGFLLGCFFAFLCYLGSLVLLLLCEIGADVKAIREHRGGAEYMSHAMSSGSSVSNSKMSLSGDDRSGSSKVFYGAGSKNKFGWVCPKCQQDNQDSALFCVNCGYRKN